MNPCAEVDPVAWVREQRDERTVPGRVYATSEKFDTYRFADYQEKAIDLRMRVIAVSMPTQTIVKAMRLISR